MMDLSIVVVNTNGKMDTLNCLQSIQHFPPQMDFEVLLVDNASDDPIAPAVPDGYGWVRHFRLETRLGFAKAYNFGIARSRGEYILILNNDTIVQPLAFDKLVAFLAQNPQFGMAGPRLILPNGKVQPEAARPFPTPLTYVLQLLALDPGTPPGRLFYRYQQKRGERRQTGTVPCIVGACMILRRKDLERIGLLDEVYDFYYEDVEWCDRVWKAGYSVGYVRESEIVHLGDRTMAKLREFGQQSQYFGALRYFYVSGGRSAIVLWVIWLASIASFLMRGSIFFLISFFRGENEYARIYFRLFGWVLRTHPGTARVQETIRAKRYWTGAHGERHV